jgi:hypothetical protein
VKLVIGFLLFRRSLSSVTLLLVGRVDITPKEMRVLKAEDYPIGLKLVLEESDRLEETENHSSGFPFPRKSLGGMKSTVT